jgi:outer membrane biosynthesis protein TonB
MVGEQLESERLSLASYSVARAFALSLLFHLLLFLTIELGYQRGLWKTTVLFSKQQAKLDAEAARLRAQAKKWEELIQEIPLMFVDVDPSQASEEAPKEAKYYSALNSRAANPNPKKDSDTPRIEGRQERVPQTMDKAKPAPQALQPEPAPQPQTQPQPQVAETKPPEPETPPAQQEAPPTPTVHPGDLAYAKPNEHPMENLETKPAQPAPPAKPPRPRTLAAARREKGGMAGEKMKQEGGVKRLGVAGLDVRSTPFGSYDAAIIAAIQKRWYDLLEDREFSGSFAGKVVLEFRLNSNGRVTDLKVDETDVTEILTLFCQRAVQDPAPFPAWPEDLKRLVGKEYREVRFTFYYN